MARGIWVDLREREQTSGLSNDISVEPTRAMTTKDWERFLHAADEWLVVYSIILLPFSMSTRLFTVGHAVELYLKGTLSKLTGDIEAAIRYGHDIKKMWNKCKQLSNSFMPSFDIKGTVFKLDYVGGMPLDAPISQQDRKHYFQNVELYTVAKILPDLKYAGVSYKQHKGGMVLFSEPLNPYWIKFFRELRTFLVYPQKDSADTIRFHIANGGLPAESIAYLEGLYT